MRQITNRVLALAALVSLLIVLARCSSSPPGGQQQEKPAARTQETTATTPAQPSAETNANLVTTDEKESPAERAFLAGDFRKAFAVYRQLLLDDINSPVAEYFFARLLEVVGCSGLDFSREYSQFVEAELNVPMNHLLICYARLVLAQSLLQEGDTSAATTEITKLGFVRDWMVVGPFDNEGEAGLNTAEPPENEINQDAEYQGKQGKNRWFVPAPRPVYGTVNMAALFRLDENVMAYAATFVCSPDDREVALRLGSDGAVKLWLNNQLLHANDAYRACQFDQDIVYARLRKGWNYLLLKLCQKRGPWRFALRITAHDGKPAEGLQFEPCAAKLPEPWKPGQEELPVAKPATPSDCISHLDAAVIKNPDDLVSRMRRAFLLATRSVRDENDRFARDEVRSVCDRLAKLGKPCALYLRLLALLEERRNGKLDALRKALALEPHSPVLSYEMSRLYAHTAEGKEWESARGRHVARLEDEYMRQSEMVSVPMEAKEKENLERALRGTGVLPVMNHGQDGHATEEGRISDSHSQEVPPDRQPYLPAVVALAELYENRGGAWIFEARRLYQIAYSLNPANMEIRKTLDSFVPAPQQERLTQLQAYLAGDFADFAARGELVMLYRALGRYDDAAKELRNRLLLDPYDFNAHLELAELLTSIAKTDEAVGSVNDALQISPESHMLFERLGHVCMLAGKPEEARTAWERSLVIKPNQPDLEKRLRFLVSGGVFAKQTAAEEFWKGYEEDLKPIIEAAQAEKDDSRYGSATAVFLLKHDLIRINPNGTSRTFSQRIIKILTDKAAREFQTVSAFPRGLDYYPEFKAEVRQAKLIKPDGTTIEGTWKADWAAATFQKVDKGDIIVFECQLEESGEPRYKGYFALMLPFQVGSMNSRVANRTERSKITLLHPKEKPIYSREVRCSPSSAAVEKENMVVRVWEVADLPEVDEEPFMPAFYEVVPYLHMSTFKTWEEVAEWYWGVIKDQFESSEQIKEAVRSATKDAKTDEEKILALYHKLVTDVRYEALRLSDHSYRPFKASHTYARKYGDCKDVATLLVVMLAEAGIEADFVLARALDGFNGHVDLSSPSMRIFNHAIVHIPPRGTGTEVPTGQDTSGAQGTGLFLDATARYCGARELPSMDQGAVAFIMKKGGGSGRSVLIPYAQPEENLIRTHAVLEIQPDGGGILKTTTYTVGQSAGDIRSIFQEGTRRKEIFEKRAGKFFPGCEVKQCEFSDLANYSEPVTYSATVAAPQLGRREENRLALPINPMRHALTRALATLETRKYELVMAYLYRIEAVCDYNVPPGWRLVEPSELPREVSYSCKGATYTMKCAYKPAENCLSVSTEFVVREPRILQADYPDFRKFCADVDKLEEEEVVLEKE